MPARETEPTHPLAAWELRRLARGGEVARTRLIVGVLLVVVLVAVGVGVNRVADPTGRPRFGEPFAFAVVVVQFLGVLLLAPGYGAAAVAAEKERRTLETLLSTPLDHRRIVAGKFVARAVLVGSLVLVGLPVSAIALTLGGVDPLGLLTAYVVTLGTAAVLTAVGLLAACRSGDTRGAMFRAYGWSAAYVFTLGVPCLGFLSPVVYLMLPLTASGQSYVVAVVGGFVHTVLQLIAAYILVGKAAAGLRREEDYRAAALLVPAKPIRYDRPSLADVPPEDIPAAPFFVPSNRGARPHPGHFLDYDPLWWKEKYVAGALPVLGGAAGRKLLRTLTRMAGLACAMFMLGGLSAGLSDGPGAAGGRLLLLVSAVIALAVCFTGVGCSAAGAIAAERQRRTLDGLLTLPHARSAVLAAKWVAAWRRSGGWVPVAAFALFTSMLGHGILMFGGLLAATVGAGLAVASYGLWASVRSETPGRAVLRVLPVVLAAAGLPVVAWLVSDATGWTHRNTLVAYALFGAAGVLGLTAWALWRDAVRRLDEGVTPFRPPVEE